MQTAPSLDELTKELEETFGDYSKAVDNIDVNNVSYENLKKDYNSLCEVYTNLTKAYAELKTKYVSKSNALDKTLRQHKALQEYVRTTFEDESDDEILELLGE